ncbi:hypothetical protein NMY22_g16650 [Coprinellus aureogranulatus]|nr:hypothetical protein NMY22_g16650 [Coprinellus aureogranulatus]
MVSTIPKRKVKSSTYVPTNRQRQAASTPLSQAPPHSPPKTTKRPKATLGRTLATSKLKKNDSGGFTVVNRRALSGAAIPNVVANDPRSAEEILDGWYSGLDDYGWDREYVDSFVEKDLPPPADDPEIAPQAEKASGLGDTVLHDWTKEIDTYLRVLITLEGRGSNPPSLCPGRCSPSADTGYDEPLYRCLSCCNTSLLCRECMRAEHVHLPLHRIEKWNGVHFERSSLKALGVRIQLGHPPGERCYAPARAFNDDFVVIDCDMVHSVAVDYCTCGHTAKPEFEQLLERRFYPATIERPKTAATFRALELFEMLHYESKITPYEFYKTVSRLTDNTGTDPPKDRYPSLLRMVHEWRHTRLLKRSGKGHDEGGVESTKPGELAVLCPPCPHPGINMAEGWDCEEEDKRYIHALNVGLDANYRLKRKDVSDDVADPGLIKGFAYFVDEPPFRKFVLEHENDTEPKSDCSRHDAVNLADIRPGQGYAATGVATVECTRHNMKRPGGVCDLQKGERYGNMDYILVTSCLVFGLILLKTFIISYDIACQWSKALYTRLANINKDVPLLRPDSQTRFAVPKFHLPAHIPNCQTRFAFMFTPGAGLCDGEAPERGWADSNPLGPSTREMGPGTRRDTIDLNFGDYNWRHIMGLDASLLKKMEVAVWGVAERVLAHAKFEEGLKEKNPAQISQWLQDVIAWEKDPAAVPSPFNMTISTPSQCAVRRTLADEEAAQRAVGKSFSLTPDMSQSQLIARGMDLESEMRSLKHDLKQTWDHSRDRELTKVQLKSNTIVRKVDAWYRYLQLYIPSSIVLREEFASNSKSVKPYDLPLWLPSQIGRRAPVPDELARIEFRLRQAQALDALTTIRRNLQRRVTVWDLKDRWLRGQGANTRALNLISTLQRKIQAAKEEYAQARIALLSLAPLLGEKNVDKTFLVLEDSDIVSLTPESVTAAPSQGQTKQVKKSWIWNHPGVYNDDLTAYEAEMLKIEWAKSRARANRYQEEVNIVREEMNRTLRFFLWKEDQWRRRATAKVESSNDSPASPEHAEGLSAYAARQAHMYRRLHNKCENKWVHVDRMIIMAQKEVEEPGLLLARQERERKKAEAQHSSSRTKRKCGIAKDTSG